VTDNGEVTLPSSGALTFLFTDIEGSTRKAHELGDDWFAVLEAHHAILRPVFAAHGGVEVSTAGDSFFVVFTNAAAAVASTIAMQRAIAAHDWSPHPQVKVRMGMHTGLARFRSHDNDYAGLTVHAASRVESAAAGAQVLITQATLDAAQDEWPDGVDALDLGAHRLKDLPAELQLFQLVADGLEREFPPVRGLDVVRNNVPVPPSTFIGRTEVLSRLHRMLDDDRLVTVVGPGGTGKTRVVQRLATERLHRHADGVWFADLSSAIDEASVVNAVAHALGVREDGDSGLLDSVVDDVQQKNVLLAIDNCEQVIDAAAVVIERLLASGGGVRVVATSREPLELEGERLFPLSPLSVDDGEAVALLVDRVRLIDPEFELDEDVRGHVEAIAQRLDGLPLALELAAASAATLPLAEIAQQLDDRFALLTKGKRTASDRQKTLWGAIDWSYSLLSNREQTLFRRLGVFPAEFDFGVGRKICGEGIDEVDDTLSALTRKSLVAESPTTRLRYLESIRAYARDALATAGELEVLAERHARFFVAEDAESDDEWVDVVHEDLAAALRWGAEHDRVIELRALLELQGFWLRKGRLSEARAASAATLGATEDLEIPERRRALAKAGYLATSQGDTTAGRAYFEQAIELAERTEPEATVQILRADLGAIALAHGDVATAESLYRRALDAARASKNREAVGICLSRMAEIAVTRGELPAAWNFGMEALDVARELQWSALELPIMNILGMVAHQRGELDQARQVYSDALALAKRLESREHVPFLLYSLAQVELGGPEPRAAAPFLLEAIALCVETGAQADLTESLEATARLLAASDANTAAAILAAADALRDAIGFARQPDDAANTSMRAQLDGVDAPELDLDAAVTAALAALAG
jgi:predicted ATPase/class 3 adenylate cyclase/predicted negative regulator of RcsB-dependent stress response